MSFRRLWILVSDPTRMLFGRLCRFIKYQFLQNFGFVKKASSWQEIFFLIWGILLLFLFLLKKITNHFRLWHFRIFTFQITPNNISTHQNTKGLFSFFLSYLSLCLFIYISLSLTSFPSLTYVSFYSFSFCLSLFSFLISF